MRHYKYTSRVAAVAFAVAVVAVLAMPGVVVGNELDDMLYDDMAQEPCVRLINAFGSVGCSTPSGEGRVSGLLFHVDSVARVEEFRALSDDHERTVLLTPDMFTGQVIQQLTTPLLAAVVVLSEPTPGPLSPASTKPQSTAGLDPDYEWNPTGSDMLAQRYPFPIVRVDASNGAQLLLKAQANHAAGTSAFPQQAADFLFDMGPPGLTSISCLRASQCLPLGGHSVWGTVGTLDTNKKLVFMAANLDSTAMFHDMAVGAAGTASDIVALLAAVRALTRVGVSSLKHQIGFGLFQGEAWGRIGSRRFVSEVNSFTCRSVQGAATSVTGKAFCGNPVRTDLSFQSLTGDSFAHVIAIDQAGSAGATPFLHKTGTSTLDASVLNAAVAGSSGLSVVASTVSEMPPSPLSSWVQQWNATDGAVFSSYDTAYANSKFFSSFDNAANADAAQTAKFATSLARTVYAMAAGWNTTALAGQVPAGLEVDEAHVEAMLQCFTVRGDCTAFAAVLGVTTATLQRFTGTGPMSLYTGVNRPSRLVVSSSGQAGFVIQPSVVELIVRTYLNNLTASERRGACTSTAACKEIDTKLECQSGTCVVPTVHYHEALSSSLESNGASGYFMYEANVNEPHADPLWTEPFWSSDIGMRTFTAGNPETGVLLLLCGIGVVLLSVLVVCGLRRMLETHFKVQ